MWKELVIASEWAGGDPVSFGPPATAHQLQDLEARLGVTLPPDLRSLLLEFNNVYSEFGCDFLLSVDKIAEYTEELRSWEVFREDSDDRPQPVNDFVVFSSVLGNGDLYAFAMKDVESFSQGAIVHWDHETNERTFYAADLRAYIADGNPGIR